MATAKRKPLAAQPQPQAASADTLRLRDLESQLAAIGKSQAVIEFDMDATVLTANDNFLHAMGYRLDDVVGKHHSMFVDGSYTRSEDYRSFWDRLRNGEYQAGEYRRVDRNGNDVWIQASYNPILGTDGRPYKVVKFATDITQQRLKNADFEGQIAAIEKAQAVIEFDMDGTIRRANDNFLGAMDYRLDEIKGKHAQMDKNTQQNAAMVEQASAAAESMSKQAHSMADLMRFFTLAPDGAPNAESRRRPEPRAQSTDAAPRAEVKSGSNGQRNGRLKPQRQVADTDWKEF